MSEDQVRLMEQLHAEHAAGLWGYCLHLTSGDAARAQDVCQETLRGGVSPRQVFVWRDRRH